MPKDKDKMTITIKLPKPRSEVAKSLEDPRYAHRVEKNAKAYDRNKKGAKDFNLE